MRAKKRPSGIGAERRKKEGVEGAQGGAGRGRGRMPACLSESRAHTKESRRTRKKRMRRKGRR